jgi:hypothetical protein
MSVHSFKPRRMATSCSTIKELTTINAHTARQVQMLWEIHSERFAVHWKAPHSMNIEALEAAALRLVKQEKEECKQG